MRGLRGQGSMLKTCPGVSYYHFVVCGIDLRYISQICVTLLSQMWQMLSICRVATIVCIMLWHLNQNLKDQHARWQSSNISDIILTFRTNQLSNLIYYYQVSLTFTNTICQTWMSFLIAGLAFWIWEVRMNLKLVTFFCIFAFLPLQSPLRKKSLKLIFNPMLTVGEMKIVYSWLVRLLNK